MPARIVLLNDRARYNARYRSYLVDQLENRFPGRSPSMGLLDSPFNLIKLISARFSGVIVVSSNLKANLAALIVGAQGPSILNGLGRFQYSPVFRFIFLRLVRIRKRRKFFFVQRYRDYRWLRLNVPGIQMEWMLGSGAEPMDVSVVRTPGTYVVISRPEKLKVMEHQMAAAVDC